MRLVTAGRSSSGGGPRLAGGDLDDFLDRIDGLQPHADMIVAIGRDAQPDHVGLDGELAMAAVDQDRQADCTPAGPGRRWRSGRRGPSGR